MAVKEVEKRSTGMPAYEGGGLMPELRIYGGVDRGTEDNTAERASCKPEISTLDGVEHIPGFVEVEKLRALAWHAVEKLDDQNNLFIVDEIEWPDIPMKLRVWNHEIMLELSANAERDPKDSFNNEKAVAAKDLYELIPRAEALHWYIIMLRNCFRCVAWYGCSINAATYSLARVVELKRAIEGAEESGLPKEISPTALHDCMKSLRGALCTWDRERQDKL